MRLDNSITKEVYDLKEEEIKTKLSNLDEELKELQKLNEDNKNISTKIKEIEKDEVQKNLNINDESINNSTLKVNIDEDINGYEVISLENNINLDNYKTYYKVGKNGN